MMFKVPFLVYKVPFLVYKVRFLVFKVPIFVHIAKITGAPDGAAHNALEYRGRRGKDIRELRILGGLNVLLKSMGFRVNVRKAMNNFQPFLTELRIFCSPYPAINRWAITGNPYGILIRPNRESYQNLLTGIWER